MSLMGCLFAECFEDSRECYMGMIGNDIFLCLVQVLKNDSWEHCNQTFLQNFQFSFLFSVVEILNFHTT